MDSAPKRVVVGRSAAANGTLTVKPSEPKYLKAEVRHVPSLNGLLSDAYAILGAELRYYAKRSAQSVYIALDDDEAKIVGGHVRALALLAAEEREARKIDDAMSQLTDDQLKVLAKQAIKALAAKDPE